jgi:formamidopyrimidine-DNA glycosylase
MPELPEVETVRRMLEHTVVGRTIAGVTTSGLALRSGAGGGLARALRGRRIEAADRRGKFLLLPLDGGRTVISHLGMSGRWLFYDGEKAPPLDHVHARIRFADGTRLWFQDPRRFGVLKVVRTDRLDRDASLARLGRDPVHAPPGGPDLAALARGARTSVKSFLLDQRKIAGIGNIYASEILHRAAVDPRRTAGAVKPAEWDLIAREIPAVLGEAIERMGTTFSTYRTLWNEPGTYGDRLLVYDRAGEPCRGCGRPILRIVQGARSTFFCPGCQPRRGRNAGGTPASSPLPRRPNARKPRPAGS